MSVETIAARLKAKEINLDSACSKSYAERLIGYDLGDSSVTREQLLQGLDDCVKLGLNRVNTWEASFHARKVSGNNHKECHPWYNESND